MNANVTKSNSGKLLIAVLAMAMIVAGCAVVFSDETQAATVDEKTFLDEITAGSGVYTVDGDEEVTITSPITNLKEIKLADGVQNGSLTINFQASEKYQAMIVVDDTDGLTIDGNVKVTLNMTSSITDTSDGLTVFGGNSTPDKAVNSTGTVTVTNGAALTISQDANAHGASWRAGKLVVSEGATVDFNKANSTGSMEVDLDNATLKITNPNATPGNLKGDASNSKIIVTGSNVNSLNLYNISLTNSIVETDGNVGVYEGCTVEMKDENSSITADQVFSKNSSADDTATISGGKVVADIVNTPDKAAEGAAPVENMTLSGTDVTGTVTPETTAGAGGFTLNGNDIDAGTTVYSGAITSDTDVADGSVFVDVTVNPGVTVTLANGANIKVMGDMRLYGSLAVPNSESDTATLTVGQDATLTAYSGAKVGKGVSVVTEGNGKVDLTAAMSTVTLNDDIESDFKASQSQKVVIADTLTIKSGYKMEILGELVINEGCTVIIEDGAKLIVGGDDIQATGMTVNGIIEVEEGGLIDVKDAKAVTVNGEIASSGSVSINSTVDIKNGGSIDIDDSEGSVITVSEGLTVENGGSITVAGDMDVTGITNKGAVTLDGANIISTSTITMGADDAVVDIKSMTQSTGANLTITDLGMIPGKNKAGEDVTIADGQQNNIYFAATSMADVGVRGLTVTSSVTSETVDKEIVYHNEFILSGSVSIYDNTEAGDFSEVYSIALRGNGAINVPESLTLGKNVLVNLAGGEMNVDGTIDATADGSVITSSGEINVNGMITAKTEIKSGINAFTYSDDDYFYYTTLKTSIDNGATDIEYLGNVTVLDTLTIPSGTEISRNTANGEKMTIGNEDNRDVIVTVADGATIRNSNVDVMGTLVFDNYKTGSRGTNDIKSDVIIDAEPKRTYTNIYTALEDAADGSTVTIARNVFLDKDAEVRQTITLEIPAGNGLYLDDGVTLTVNGTIQNSGAIGNAVADELGNPDTSITMAGFNPYLADGVTANDDRAEIIANGTIMSMEELPYGTYYIVGAYYQLVNDQGAWNYITPVEQAAAVSNDVENGIIEIYGENTVGDVTFTGDADQAVTVTVKSNGALTDGTITLDRAGLFIEGDFTGTVASAAGSVDVVNATGFSVVDTYVDETEVTYLDGTPVAADAEQDSSVTIATGTVNAGQIEIVTDDTAADYIGSFAIESGATLMVSGEYEDAVASISASEMTVNGTLTANDGGKVTVTDLTVRGTFNVMSADDEAETDAGVAEITNMFVGIAKDGKTGKFVDASAAAVNSDETIGKLNMVYVSGESTVTGKMIEKMKYTQFFVEDALWMTVYTVTSNNGADLALVTGNVGEEVYFYQPGDLNNSEFSYWADSEGEKIVTADNAKIGGADYQQVYANLNYNIYTITVFADPGIEAVYIDGKLMTSGTFQTGVDGMWAQGFRLSVAAGEHEITYKLGNYFSGEADMTVNGSAVDGNKFTTSGTTTADKNVTIYLQGINASAPETPSTTGGDDGMGLTDYLLIILVILIVVMAIIVAMRLMRS